MNKANLSILINALKPIVEAIECNDSDTLGMVSADDNVIWVAENSWGGPSAITIGDLRKIKSALDALNRDID